MTPFFEAKLRVLRCIGSVFIALLEITPMAVVAGSKEAHPAKELEPIDVSGFHDSAHHWRFIRDEGRFIQALPDQPSYTPDHVREIAANILLFQRENGGWPKDYDMTAVLTEEQKDVIKATRNKADSSYDNGNLHSQVSYLAHAYAEGGDESWREACLRGFDFLLATQYSNGGFPQRFPDPKGFHAHITFNDYVMIGILNVLRDAADSAPHFVWLDAARQERAQDAVKRATECILKCQIEVEGQRTGWCQQHDEITFAPRSGRTFELASICPQDTTEIVRFLMRETSPNESIQSSVDGAVAWLKIAALKGVRLEKVKAEREEFQRYTADFDKVIVQDPSAPRLWARHYEVGTNRPIFASRDGVKKYAFAEIERERRTGTPWFGTWPEKLIDKEYPAWQRNFEASRKKE